MQPIGVACGRCAAQPGEPCTPPVDPQIAFHAERIDAANFITGVDSHLAGDDGFTPGTTQFNAAVLATGDV